VKPVLKKLPPEEVEFCPGEFYYVKRKGSSKIEGLRCIATDEGGMQSSYGMDWAVRQRRNTKKAFGPDGTVSPIYLAKDIEYVLSGVPIEILHEANIRAVWGK
jgi:hypothetical protein